MTMLPVESSDPILVPKRVALVRPDTRPLVRRTQENFVMTFPHLIVREIILFQVVVIALSVIALLFNAPLEGIANPLHYVPPVVAGVVLPGLVVACLVVIPYADINLTAGPLWPAEPARARRTALGVGAATAAVALLFAAFQCWPVVIPTLGIAAAMFLARSAGPEAGFRGFLRTVTLPEWIFTWFVLVATILTVLGTFFRGPGWTLVWPWNMNLPG